MTAVTSNPSKTQSPRERKLSGRVRDWFAASLGVGSERKEELYVELSKAATLKDFVYWLQIFFAAGIATLGLILNSPAVIIGAMLISPLMGPILASGLAFATGDLILGVRAAVNLFCSCLAAIAFAGILVALLPFKEMTTEIAGRTSPTTLDLFIALFSGAIGSIAVCREVRGVVTSIPGVAIAVALMPPLCVVGYGIGVALSLNRDEGIRTASGGGLLFLTNLVAITLTAMIVFLLLHIDTHQIRAKVEAWRNKDGEHLWWHHLFEKIPTLDRAREIRSVPFRAMMILVPLVIILIPLTQSFFRLKSEITKQQQENRIQRAALNLWQQDFERSQNGDVRSYLDELSIKDDDGKVQVFLRVFDNVPYTAPEKTEYVRLLASNLNLRPDSIALQIVEIPTSSRDAKQRQQSPTPPSVAQLQTNFLQRVESLLNNLHLPPPALEVDYQVSSGPSDPLHVQLSYLSEREIDGDAKMLLAEEIKTRLSFAQATLGLERIPTEPSVLEFQKDSTNWIGSNPLDQFGFQMKRHPRLHLEITLKKVADQEAGILEARKKVINEYLQTNWTVTPERVLFVEDSNAQNSNGRLLLTDNK